MITGQKKNMVNLKQIFFLAKAEKNVGFVFSLRFIINKEEKLEYHKIKCQFLHIRSWGKKPTNIDKLT